MAHRLNFPEFPDYYRSLSLRLCQVLGDVGASTALRDERVKTATAKEILHTFTSWLHMGEGRAIKRRSAFYHVGSSYEGTTIPGLKSDIDNLVVQEMLPVVTVNSDAQPYHHCLLMVQDSSTPAGYFKLQLVINGEPQFFSLYSDQSASWHRDKEGRAVYVLPFVNSLNGTVPHGPAQTLDETETTTAQDIVIALKCCTMPDCASEWFTRQRHYNWPSSDCIEKCKTLGCFFVRVGHPYSEERGLEWRLSFSLQERLLVTSFNSVQLKCFILLKVINKVRIKQAVVENALTSYHCKTCMLYMIENTPAVFWREDNLLHCLHSCLNMIDTWVETGVCPNYFIPAENMFDGKIFGGIRIRLQRVLSSILAADFMFLIELRTDGIGQRFQEAIVAGPNTDGSLLNITPLLNSSRLDVARFILGLRLESLDWCQGQPPSLSVACKRLKKSTSELERTETITEHTREETSYVLSLLLPYVQISFMSVLTVLAHQSHRSSEYIFQLLMSEKWHQISLQSDSFTSTLKQASLLYMLGFNDLSLDVLLHLEGNLRRQLSYCSCSWERFTRLTREDVSHINAASVKELLKWVVPCVVFLPEESDLMPHALCYELNGLFIKSLLDGSKIFYKLVVVDGKILLYFLLYLNHRHFDMEAHATADVDNIIWVIRTDRYLGHRDVAFNILGWIYKERGLIREAVECFQESLKLQPVHNAAFQHLRDLESSS